MIGKIKTKNTPNEYFLAYFQERFKTELASLNLKLPSTLKNDFTQTAEALGMPAATALKVLITRFVEVGGFPFDVRIQRQGFNWNDPRIIKTYHQNGKLMMPAQWRDEDDDDDVE